MTANEQYIFLETEIKQQIKLLEKKLLAHARKQRSHIENYGYVGDLGYVKSNLKEINDFLIPSIK